MVCSLSVISLSIQPYLVSFNGGFIVSDYATWRYRSAITAMRACHLTWMVSRLHGSITPPVLASTTAEMPNRLPGCQMRCRSFICRAIASGICPLASHPIGPHMWLSCLDLCIADEPTNLRNMLAQNHRRSLRHALVARRHLRSGDDNPADAATRDWLFVRHGPWQRDPRHRARM